MIVVYDAKATSFDNLGLGKITPSAVSVIEERNGQYKVTITHPIDEDGKWQKLKRGRIVVVPTHDGLQPFRLYKPYVNSHTGVVEASGVHIFYDLVDNFIEDVRPTIKTGQEAGDAILAGMQYDTPHTFESDVETANNAYYIRKNPVEAFIGNEDNAFKNRWPSVIKRDWYKIIMNTRRGSDKGFRISYRKNLIGVEMSEDDSRVVTRIRPIALDENGTVFTTDKVYYDSPLIGNYPHPKIAELDTGIRVGQEVDGTIPYPDTESAKAAMAAMAQAAFDAGCDRPEMVLRVRFVDLGDTEEYAQYKGLVSANIDDDVTIYHEELGIEVKARVVSIEWDGLRNRANEIVLGTVMPNYANTAVSKDIDISDLKKAAYTNIKEGERYNGVYITHSDGFVTVAEIDGHTIKTKQNSQDGFAIYDGNDFIGGITLVNGQIVNVSHVISNRTGTTAYVAIGEITVNGEQQRGIFVYNGDISTTQPAFMLTSFGDPQAGEYEVRLHDTEGYGHISIGSWQHEFLNSWGDGLVIAQDEVYLRYMDYMIGVDSNGIFKDVNGTRTYL